MRAFFAKRYATTKRQKKMTIYENNIFVSAQEYRVKERDREQEGNVYIIKWSLVHVLCARYETHEENESTLNL